MHFFPHPHSINIAFSILINFVEFLLLFWTFTLLLKAFDILGTSQSTCFLSFFNLTRIIKA